MATDSVQPGSTVQGDPPAAQPAQRSVHRRMLDHLPQVRKPTGWFTREAILGSLKTLAWVLPLTLLIWIYAENSTPTTGDVVLPLEFRTDATDRHINIKSPADRNIRCELSGPKAGIERVRAKMLDPLRNRVEITIPKEELPQRGLKEYSIREAVARLPLFKENAVTLTKCDPSIFQLDIDPVKTQRLPVEARIDEGGSRQVFVYQENTNNPLMVEVTAPQSAFDGALDEIVLRKMNRSGKLAVFADVSLFLDKAPGSYPGVNVPIFLPGRGSGVYMPPSVQCTIDVKPVDTASFLISAVPIRILAPAKTLEENSIQVTDGDPVKNVTVVGPRSAIDALKAHQDVYAILRPDASEGAHTLLLKGEDFHLPKDLAVVEGTHKVEYTVTHR